MKSIQRHDLDKPDRLYLYLKELEEYTRSLEKSLADTSSFQLTDDVLRRIRDQLQAGGVAPLNTTGLAGRQSESQNARIPKVTSHPDPLTTDYDFYILDSTPDELWTINREVNPPVREQIIATSANHNLLSATHTDTTAASPVLGDLIVSDGTPKWIRLAGHINAAKRFLRQTGTGAVSAVPAWDTIASTDLTDTASIIRFNAQNQFDSSTQFSVYAVQTSLQSVPNNTTTAITLDSESDDQGGLHDNVTNNSRITIPTGGDGIYLFVGQLAFAANSTGVRRLLLMGNGTLPLARDTDPAPSAAEVSLLHVATIRVLAATDYAEIHGYQNSGAGLNTDASSGMTFLAAHKLA